MERQNILTGIKVLSNNYDDPLAFTHNQSGVNENHFLSIKQNSITVRSQQNYKVFKFDCCLGQKSTQQQVYDNFCLSMAQDFVEGYDCTLILCGYNNPKSGYNQIILGKGSQQTKGLIPRFIDQITNSIRYLSQRKCLFKVSMLEINEEQMIDLLGVKRCKLDLKQQKINKNEFYVTNLQVKSLQQIDEIQSFYLLGNRKRQYAYSKSYRKRQNSTVFFTVYLESLDGNGTTYRKSKFTFCELSHNAFEDSEPFSDQIPQPKKPSSKFPQIPENNSQNTGNLNLSNYAFQNVINTLVYGDESVNVPFRDSKITKLLQPSLGGSHKTAILGTIDAQNQASLAKTFKIMKTLQIAAQIQNCPINLKPIQSEQTNPQAHNIVNLLEQINQLSNELDRTKMDLHNLLNNNKFVSDEVKKIKDKNGHSLVRDNQFCSQQYLEDRVLEEKTKKQWILKQKIKELEKKLKENISYIQNLKDCFSNDDQNNKNLINEEDTINKRKKILMRVRSIKEQRLSLIPNLQPQQIERDKKREIFGLKIQFQKQRNLYTSTIRNLEEKLSFYKKIAQNSLKIEEIQLIKANSKYDETKRQFQIPMFMIKDKKMRPGNMVSPSVSQRKFLVTPRSSSFDSDNSIALSKKTSQPWRNGTKDLKRIHDLLERRPQIQEILNSEYQIGNKNSQKQSKKVRKQTEQQEQSRQVSIRVSRNKQPLQRNKVNKTKTLLARVKSSEHINTVRSEYQIGEVDINRVLKYNQQRKLLKSREKVPIVSRDKNIMSPSNLLRRQKLNTQPISVQNHIGEDNLIGSPEKSHFPNSPFKKIIKGI